MEQNDYCTYTVGQGLRPALSTQGSNEVQDIFHPPHWEYVLHPHAGQNFLNDVRQAYDTRHVNCLPWI